MSTISDRANFESLGCIFIKADFTTFRIAEVSPSIETVLGYTPAACRESGFLLDGLVHPEDAEYVVARMMEIFEGGRVEIEFRAVHADGSSLDMLALFGRVPAGTDLETPTFDGVMFEHRGGARQKSLTDARLQLALDSADMGVWEWNLSEWSVFWSDQVYRLHGVTREEVGDLFENPDALLVRVHPEDLPGVQQLVLHALRTGRDYDIEYRFRVDDEHYRWIYVKGRIYSDEDGQPLRIAGTAQDITARKDAELAAMRELKERRRTQEKLTRLTETLEERVRERTSELERANSQLTQLLHEKAAAERELERMNRLLVHSNEELRDFAHVASHDLQEPLRKITTFADLLRADYGNDLNGEGLHFLDRMQQSAHRMTRLIDDLLKISQLNTGQVFVPTDLNAVLRDVLADLEIRIRESAASIHLGDLPTIDADGTQMRRLFQNLISNALKFRRADVPPVVEIHAKIADHAAKGTVCRLEVKDNGIGIDEQYTKRIFAPFQRLDREFEGTGIGLAICRRIVELHQGRIYVVSTPDEGATFVVELPVKKPDSAPISQQFSGSVS